MSKALLYMFISTLAFSLMNLLVKFLPNIPPHELIFFDRSFLLFSAFLLFTIMG